MAERPETIISNDELLWILKKMEESGWDEIELITKNFKFKAGKTLSGDHNTASTFLSNSLLSSKEKANPVNEAISDNAGVGFRYEPEVKPSHIPKDNAGVQGTAIYAPMIGTFYRAPSPGAPPFVEVGDVVTEDTIVGIIEVMKVMSSIKAGLRGRISSVLVENAQMVQYNQPLFLIDGEDQSAEATHE